MVALRIEDVMELSLCTDYSSNRNAGKKAWIQRNDLGNIGIGTSRKDSGFEVFDQHINRWNNQQ